MAAQILLTAMLVSFALGLGAMVYDATGGNLNDRAAKVVTVIYLWPVVIVAAAFVVFTITLIWSFPQ